MKKMDLGTALIILLIVGAIVALLAALVLIYGKFTDINSSRYERKLAAEQQYDTAIINAAKVMVVGKMAFIAVGVGRDNKIIYDERPIDDAGTPITTSAIDGVKVTQHQLAARLVDDSISARGADGVKLLTADEWKKLGHEHEEHKEALAYLMPLGVVKVQGGRADQQGTYVKKGETLQALLRDLAVYALPLATGQKLPLPQDESRVA